MRDSSVTAIDRYLRKRNSHTDQYAADSDQHVNHTDQYVSAVQVTVISMRVCISSHSDKYVRGYQSQRSVCVSVSVTSISMRERISHRDQYVSHSDQYAMHNEQPYHSQ